MPEPQSPCQDISRSSSPWRGTRRSPVICSLPSLITNPTLPCPACLTHEWTDRIHSPAVRYPSASGAARPAPGKTTRKCCTLPRNPAPFPLAGNLFFSRRHISGGAISLSAVAKFRSRTHFTVLGSSPRKGKRTRVEEYSGLHSVRGSHSRRVFAFAPRLADHELARTHAATDN